MWDERNGEWDKIVQSETKEEWRLRQKSGEEWDTRVVKSGTKEWRRVEQKRVAKSGTKKSGEEWDKKEW